MTLQEQIQQLRSEIDRLQEKLKRLERQEHAEHCSKEVANWPGWKRDWLVQCQSPSLSVKREPVREIT